MYLFCLSRVYLSSTVYSLPFNHSSTHPPIHPQKLPTCHRRLTRESTTQGQCLLACLPACLPVCLSVCLFARIASHPPRYFAPPLSPSFLLPGTIISSTTNCLSLFATNIIHGCMHDYTT
ncbi:hypothetical protein BO71DRAFT_207522 [Aspergillus ellipticus CBS 707.79]|uniref:Uncharacterized protein n=1 Tax=Aspergillus ellipticus CBS 707.79 TaxID=1448320 RepID=A0A319DP82_9EURO|nr:hypothetical protein BO71DRAFT_207522 [Aspergillus ellipticus CBS 707.79]